MGTGKLTYQIRRYMSQEDSLNRKQYCLSHMLNYMYQLDIVGMQLH